MNVIEVEIDTPNNGVLYFQPLDRKIRGRFDFARDSEPLAKVHMAEFPKGVPGQRLGIDLEAGVAYVAEPLHGAEYQAIRERIKKRGFGLPPERETVEV